MKKAWIGIGLATMGLSFNGCAGLPQIDNPSTPRVTERIEAGTVESIDVYRGGDNSQPGLGAVLGGIAGGVVGHQVGESELRVGDRVRVVNDRVFRQ